jgi:hypothetical protein
MDCRVKPGNDVDDEKNRLIVRPAEQPSEPLGIGLHQRGEFLRRRGRPLFVPDFCAALSLSR